LLGASAYLGRTLVDSPELIDLLVSLGQTPPTRTLAQVEADLARKLAHVDALIDPESAWNAVAEVKNGHVLRVGLADFAGALDPPAICTELTTIAEACLRAALAIVAAQIDAPGRLAILGLGKLGGRELGYAADLDLVFVYTSPSDDDDAVEQFTRV